MNSTGKLAAAILAAIIAFIGIVACEDDDTLQNPDVVGLVGYRNRDTQQNLGIENNPYPIEENKPAGKATQSWR